MKKKFISKHLFASIFLLLLAVSGNSWGQTRYYVSTGGNDANTGTSWLQAFKTLQQALAVAGVSGDQIWVAQGTYYPDEGAGNTNNNPYHTSFVMKNNLAIYGGFLGTETNLGDRDWRNNITILSGDIDQNDGANFANNDGNSLHVVINDFNDLNSTAVLDGFTITAGNANLDGSPENSGGGMYNAYSSPTVTNCTFSGNNASSGGGMYNHHSSPTVTNCIFSGNNASPGGGMFNEASPPTVTNCIFYGNTASEGGGMYNSSTISSGTVTNCTFSGNNASLGGDIFNAFSSITVTNCILWGNSSSIGNNSSSPAVSYSIVQDGYPGIGNKDQDPLFVSQPGYNTAPTIAGNLRLQPCSPAINAGNDAANSTTTDLDGNARKIGVIDMGAYEFEKKNYQVSICHKGKEMCVSANSVQAHLNHGDKLGPCTYAPREGNNNFSNPIVLSPTQSPSTWYTDWYATTAFVSPVKVECGQKATATKFQISNYPNPFTNSTRIQYCLPYNSKVTVKVYDMLGRAVTTLVDGEKKAGINNVDFDGSKLGAGNYYYRINAIAKEKEFTHTGSMIKGK